MRQVAIVGGGPAGATAAQRLRDHRGFEERFRVALFEEKLAWEKPCGGGLPAKAALRYPFLLDACHNFTRVREAELAAGNGEAVRLHLRGPLLVYSRATLNHLLLRRAEAAGAEVIPDRIRGFCREGARWRLQGRSNTYVADFLILAAGARTTLRQLVAPALKPHDFMLTFGYYTPAADSVLRVRFFEDFEGYAWAFPRPDHLSVGICGKCGEASMSDLRDRLHRFMRCFDYPVKSGPVFSHLLPALDSASWNSLSLAGEGWALAGDAAGLVDPLTGEGIYFAMRSGELLAEALREGSVKLYPAKVRSEFGARLAMGARLAPRFYHGSFLGKSSTTRLVQFCSRSPAFMTLLQDLFEGSQSYLGLPSRVYRTFSKGLFEMGAHAVRTSMSAEA
ncbi:MAG TPA: NAD(P)/FAD-dependent oxidoreductase [Terriglobia bacterium]|nr:NAD(P)/FAD-dependent oxidoreductase [Terriglobia bacterium]